MDNELIKEPIVVNNKKTIRISKRKFRNFMIVVFIFILLVVLGYLFLSSSFNGARLKSSDNEISIPCIESPGVQCPGSNYSYNYDNNYSQQGISDTREFLKVSYNATLHTREVKEVMKDVKDAIKLADGRIDSLHESTKESYVRFVIPKYAFEDFKTEIESLTKQKLYTENISSQNKLNEKQQIEQKEEVANNSLTSLQGQLSSLNSKHNTTINSYQADLISKQKEISNTQKELNTLRIAINNETDEDILVSLRTQETLLVSRINTLKQQESSIKQQINNENSVYSSNKQNLDNQISQANNQIVSIAKQDEKFTENVETVDGYINVNWISYWDMAKIYSPIHPSFIVIILVLGLFYYFVFRKVEFV